MINIYADS